MEMHSADINFLHAYEVWRRWNRRHSRSRILLKS